MGDFLIVSLAEELQAYEDLAQEYQVGFEINDFYDPLVFEVRNEEKILYRNIRRPGFRQEARCMGRSMMCRCLVTTTDPRDLKTSYATEHGDCPRTFGERGCIPHKLESDAF